ncbi:hypothetical protein R0381_002463 [Jeongeupia wiesaeckerbachi]|uniref:AAA family ATPase n=1 Tax=Jeongeupia wiesaeckerbachi TaxID=3051218 RepID=UPI003D8012CD
MHFMLDDRAKTQGVVILARSRECAAQWAASCREHGFDLALATTWPDSGGALPGELHHAALVIADGGDDALACVATLRVVCDPASAIVLVGSADDLSLARQVRRAGASEYFAAPVDADELARACADLQSGGSAERRGSRVVAVQGSCGGAGAGLVTAALGAIAATRYGHRAAVVDLGLASPTAGSWLGCDQPGELARLLLTPERIDHALIEQVVQRPAPQLALLDGSGAQPQLDAASSRALASALGEQYRYQFWRGSGLDAAATHGFARADQIVLVCDGTLAGVRNARELLRRAAESQKPCMLVFNQSRPDSVLDVDGLADALGRRPDHVLPYRAKLATQQLDQLALTSPAHVLASALDDLAAALLGVTRAPRRRWWSRAK